MTVGRRPVAPSLDVGGEDERAGDELERVGSGSGEGTGSGEGEGVG